MKKTAQVSELIKTIVVLPQSPDQLPTAKTIRACTAVFEHRYDIVGVLDIEQAVEWLHRAGAIEKYVSKKEHKDEAKRAARILEAAVGAALPNPKPGSRTDLKPLTHGLEVAVSPMDQSRFRLMAEYFEQWVPALVEKALSRKKVLGIIDEIRRPKFVGEGIARIEQAAANNWLQTIESADLLLTDPPYSTDVDDIEEFVESWFLLALSRLKTSARALVFIGAYAEELAAYFSTVLPDGWRWSVPHAWVYKNTIGPTPEHDFIRNWQCILSVRGPDADKLRTSRINDLLAGFVENAPDGRQEVKHHSWQKPLGLVERLISASTDEGDFVIDPFAGSGTTLLAAKAIKRWGYGCDIDESVVTTAIDRGCDAG